jgi:hypothetical protein
MAAGDTVRVRYVEGRAEVQIGDRVLHIDQSDNQRRGDTCPIELVTAALGG